MGNEALQFFADEISQGSTIVINRTNNTKLKINSQRDWNDFLTNCGVIKPPQKKDYRI